MKKILILILVLIIISAGFLLYKKEVSKNIVQAPTAENPTTTAPSPPSDTSGSTVQTQPALASVVYPIDRFDERATKNFFGSYYSASSKQNLDVNVCPQGTAWTGYHTGVDLEIFPEELNSDVPVVAIADGTVRQIGPVTGYGGLIVIEHKINGVTLTAYYGHININSSNLKTGDAVKMGQKIANLGAQCSSQNGFNRKHLHFGLHRGSAIDVKAYVPSKTALENWVDPKVFLNGMTKP